jgi:hypothetical protein
MTANPLSLQWLRGLDMLNATRSRLAIGLTLFSSSLPTLRVVGAYPRRCPGSRFRGFVTPRRDSRWSERFPSRGRSRPE